jgi:hypothetical protein
MVQVYYIYIPRINSEVLRKHYEVKMPSIANHVCLEDTIMSISTALYWKRYEGKWGSDYKRGMGELGFVLFEISEQLLLLL